MSERVAIVIRGGRDTADPERAVEEGPLTRGVDVGVYAYRGGVRMLLPVRSLVLRVSGRRAVAFCEFEVDDVALTGISAVEVIGQAETPVDEHG